MKLYVVGATGVVGRQFLKILEEENFDIDKIEVISSFKSEGTKIQYNDKYLITKSKITEFGQKNDVAVLCVDKDVSLELTPLLLSKGMYVVDCSTAFRKEKNTPLIAIGVNDNKINDCKLICNPNCVVMQIILPLYLLNNEYPIKRVDVVSFQSVSGSGKKGIDDYKNNTSYFYPYSINKTCIPLVGDLLENGYSSEEDKIDFEIKKILNKVDLEVSATCVRVPIERCHGVSLSIQFESEVNEKSIEKILRNSKWCVYQEVPNGTDAIDNDFIYFGRIRKDIYNPKIIHMYIVGDNLRRGAASNAYWIVKNIIDKNKNEL